MLCFAVQYGEGRATEPLVSFQEEPMEEEKPYCPTAPVALPLGPSTVEGRRRASHRVRTTPGRCPPVCVCCVCVRRNTPEFFCRVSVCMVWAEQSIFASALDEAALQVEEQEEVFLLQMPSHLKR